MLASAQVRHQLRRFLAPGLAVALGVAFLAATVILGASLRSSISATLTGDLQSYAAVITSAAQTPLTTAQRDAVAQLPGVREVTATRRSVAVFAGRTEQVAHRDALGAHRDLVGLSITQQDRRPRQRPGFGRRRGRGRPIGAGHP